MKQLFIAVDQAEKKSVDDLFDIFDSSSKGLSSQEAGERLSKCGPNEVEEKKTPLWRKILSYFWGPIPWMIEIACILSAVLGHWEEFWVIFVLLLVNGLVEFFQEFQAGNAIEALRKHFALKAIVLRDGDWQKILAKDLVPGDIVSLRIGNIIPADCKLIDGDYLSVDQSVLTGESLPITKKIHDTVLSSSIAKQGEMLALVVATGNNTYLGKTTQLISKAKPISHFQKAILLIGDYLIYLSIFLSICLIIVELSRGSAFLQLIQYILVLIIASIPVALPTVLTVTMSLGALKLARMHAVVTRLESIEEMAGVDVLCCDKTGTLTQNKLSLGETIPFDDYTQDQVILYGALASKKSTEDPIDLIIIEGLQDPKRLQSYKQVQFSPFDPVQKKSGATVQDSSGKTFLVAKGAIQVISALCHPSEELNQKIQEATKKLGEKGCRTLAVAYKEGEDNWQFIGILSLLDPVKNDALETLDRAINLGIEIKMLTGDNIAIAKEIARQLHLDENVQVAESIFTKEKEKSPDEFADELEKISVFAQNFPEHKFKIIKALQKKNHIVGMTGDGVNDSPALKQADVGIAVEGSTDAARFAASISLLSSGLPVIIRAIEEARRIFKRMNSYAIYRVSETIRITFFITLSIIVFKLYPITAIMVILLALLNDLPILAIAYDNTILENRPVKWEIRRLITIAGSLGFVGILVSFFLLFIARDIFHIGIEQIQSIIFLKLSVAGHLIFFVCRSPHSMFSKPYPSLIFFSAILTTQIMAACIVGFGFLLTQIPWSYIGYIWIYCIFWTILTDLFKIWVYKHLSFKGTGQTNFLTKLKSWVWHKGKHRFKE